MGRYLCTKPLRAEVSTRKGERDGNTEGDDITCCMVNFAAHNLDDIRLFSLQSGPGGIKLSYMGGDIITKTLNEAFGYDGWCLEVKNTTREQSIKDDQGRHHVAYIATVRITHHRSGVFRGAILEFSFRFSNTSLSFRNRRFELHFLLKGL